MDMYVLTLINECRSEKIELELDDAKSESSEEEEAEEAEA
jgi:hypothetical protein